MDEPGFFAKSTIAIYGLGLMGGSLALALKGKCKAVIGIARKQEVCEYALANGFVDQAYTDPNEGLPQADVVVLAAPVNVIMEMIEKLPDWHPGEAIVTDIGSTKEKIVDVMSTLPPRFSPIGGHPICGKEVLGIANADRDLYKGAPYVYTPVVHAPYLISAALALATPESYGPFTGSGFRSTARLAATPSSMMLDVLESNRQNVIEALERVQQNINSLLSNLNSNDFDEIKSILDDSAVQMENILKVKQGKP
jgi:prephenate dehydrogenase